MTKFYDVVDSDGNVIETAEEQKTLEVQGLQVKGPELTPGDLKKVRKMYVTIQHPRVAACLHELDLSIFPRHRNCEHCVFAWFNSHGELVQQLDEMHNLGKDDEIIQLQGIKFYKRFRQFMSTIARFKEENGNQA
jgi:hypothetical protein